MWGFFAAATAELALSNQDELANYVDLAMGEPSDSLPPACDGVCVAGRTVAMLFAGAGPCPTRLPTSAVAGATDALLVFDCQRHHDTAEHAIGAGRRRTTRARDEIRTLDQA